ncbi:MAG TPA: YCF48-related protein [Candidatus Sulfotelmatobacter sp.]
MRRLLPFFLLFFQAGGALGQAARAQLSHTTEGLRGVSAVSPRMAWASGTHGTYLSTTDGGAHWEAAQVPGADALDFRGVVAFSADEAFLMSSGPGELSRIYHTADGGKHWSLQFRNTNPKGFFDSIAFWDPTHGVVVGDPVPDEAGKLHFEVLLTDDGQIWHSIPQSQLPAAIEGEGAFAASNTCIAILPTRLSNGPPPRDPFKADKSAESYRIKAVGAPDPNIWFATGGPAARVFHSADHGATWSVVDTPMMHGPASAGIFSIAFRDALHGIIAGGDYQKPNQDGPNLATTDDGGKTWELSPLRPLAYFSAVAYDRNDKGTERIFIVGSDFVFDFRPPREPQRINAKDKSLKFNAVSAVPHGGALVVGAGGAIIRLP